MSTPSTNPPSVQRLHPPAFAPIGTAVGTARLLQWRHFVADRVLEPGEHRGWIVASVAHEGLDRHPGFEVPGGGGGRGLQGRERRAVVDREVEGGDVLDIQVGVLDVGATRG